MAERTRDLAFDRSRIRRSRKFLRHIWTRSSAKCSTIFPYLPAHPPRHFDPWSRPIPPSSYRHYD